MARTAPVPNIPAIPGMNPGVFVMGGGGAGGGSGGPGGDGQGDGQGGDGKNGGQSADGDGRGAGGCGQGTGAAACTNPRHGGGGSTSAGDPVDVITGRVFTLPAVDLGLPGPLPLVLERRYSSTAWERDVGLGHGWTHSFAWSIEHTRQRVTLTRDDGTTQSAPLPAFGESCRLIGGSSLRRARSGFAVSVEGGLTLLFHEQDELRGVYRLSSIVDRNGNTLRLAYDGPRLLTITDSVGRVVRVARHASGRIAGFEVKTATVAHAWLSFCRYEYDAAGDLTAVVDAEGYETRFAYREHLLTEHSLPDGLVVHYRYDAQRRCVETWGDRADGSPDRSLSSTVPSTLVDKNVAARGVFHTRLSYLGAGYTEVVDSTQLKRFFGNARGQIEKCSWGPSVQSHVYDELGNWKAYTDPLGATTQVERDAEGRALAVIDPLGRRTEHAYDELGALRSLTRPDGEQTHFERDARGNLRSVSDRMGLVVEYEYDERGSTRRAHLPNGGVTEFAYDAHGNCTSVTEPNGATKQITYDDLGRPTAMKNALGGVTYYAYDARGLVGAVQDPTGAVSRFEYDGRMRLVAITDGAGRTGRLVWGGLNALCEVHRPDGTRVAYKYDREGRFLEMHNEAGRVHRFVRNGAGHVIREETLDGRIHEMRRDLGGQLTRWIDPRSGAVDYEYDAAGQLVRRTFPDDTVDELEYDVNGRLVSARSAGVECRRDYDARGCLIREEQTLDGARCRLTFEHDTMGKRLRRSSSLGYAESMTRDLMGAIVRLDWGGESVELLRDPLGREREVVLPHGGRIAYAYDGIGRLARRTVQAYDLASAARAREPEWVGARAAGVVSDVAYRWSPVGLLEEETDSAAGTTTYRYDPVGQLLARVPAHGAAELFHYDAEGNLRVQGGAAREHGPGGKVTRKGDVRYLYDDSGRLIAKELPGGARFTYAYDGRGLLASVRAPDGETTEFTYDPLYRRVEKRVRGGDRLLRRTRFVWDGDQVLHEVCQHAQEDGDPVTEMRTYCAPDNGPVPLGEIDPSGKKRFYVHGPNGFPELVVSGDGRVEATQRQSAFGALEGDAATPIRFPGQYADPETGLYYNRHRYYDPDLGTYISADPIEIARSPRLFGYAENSPPNVVDPDGLQPMTTDITPSGASGRSSTGRDRNSPAQIHPTVWNNMADQVQVQSPNGTTNMEFPQATRHPANCSEPVALSNHLYDYEQRNGLPPGTCGSANDPNNNHLRSALRGIDGIQSTQDGGGLRNACPNCGVLIQNLQNQANQGRPEGEPPVDLVNRVNPGIDQPSQRYQDAIAAGAPRRSAVAALQNPNAPANMAVLPPPGFRPRGAR